MHITITSINDKHYDVKLQYSNLQASFSYILAFGAPTLLFWHPQQHPACKKFSNKLVA